MMNREINPASGARKLSLVAKYEWLKHFRKKRLYITSLLSIAVLILLNILLPYVMAPIIGESFSFPGDTVADFLGSGFFGPLNGIWTVLVILAIFFASDSMSMEFENRTGLLLFPNPVRRETIVIGKFIASMLMTIIVLTLYYAITWSFTLYFFPNSANDYILPFLGSYGICILFAAGLIATTFMFSAIFNKAMVTSIVIFFLYFMIFNIIGGIFSMAVGQGNLQFEPWYLISYNADLISLIIAYPSERIIEHTGPGGTTYTVVPDIIVGLVVTFIGYVLIPLIASTLIYKRRDIS
ncbi:MAG: ABC transporter permease [Candidatus Helarchaeota archaeon]